MSRFLYIAPYKAVVWRNLAVARQIKWRNNVMRATKKNKLHAAAPAAQALLMIFPGSKNPFIRKDFTFYSCANE